MIDLFHVSFLFTVFAQFIHHVLMIISVMFHFGRSIVWEFLHSVQYVKFSQSSSLVNFFTFFSFSLLSADENKRRECIIERSIFQQFFLKLLAFGLFTW